MNTLPNGQPHLSPPAAASKQKRVSEGILQFIAAPRCQSANDLFKDWRKRHVPIPSHDDLVRELAAMDLEKVVAPRLLALFQASSIAPPAAQSLVKDTAEIMFEKLGYLSGEGHQPDAAEAKEIAMDLIPKRAAKAGGRRFDLFACFLHLSLGREWLGSHDIVGLMQAAFLPQKQTKSADVGRSTNALDVLLSSPFDRKMMQPLLEIHEIHKKAHDELVVQAKALQAELATARADVELLGKAVAELRDNVAAQAAEIEGQRNQIAALQQQLAHQETAWQHRLDQVVGRNRGFLAGELSRWLQTALEAAGAEPPYLPVISQRLRSSLSSIQTQLQWLSSV